MGKPKDAQDDLKSELAGAMSNDAKIAAILKYLGVK